MATKTIGAAGDYTTIAGWSAYVKAIGTLTENEIGQLTDDANYTRGALADLNFSGLTLSGNTITLQATTNKHDGDFGNGSRVEAAVSYGGIYQSRFLIIEDFSIVNTETSNGGARCFNNCTDTVLKRVIAKTNSSGGNSEPYQIAAGCHAEACRAVGGTTGFNLINNSAYISACTAINAGVGFTSSGATNAVYNNVAYNCTTGWSGTWTGGGTNNASEDGTHAGTSGVTISGDPFEADGYTPAAAGQLDGAGVDLSISLDAANNPYAATPAIGAYAVIVTETVEGSGVLGASPLGVLPLGTITAAAVDGATNLIISDAVHTLVSDNAALTQAHSIIIQSGLHGLTSDNVTLDAATSVDLVISEAAHSLISDNIALAQEHNLAVASSLHGLVSDNVALTQAHVLSIADALQSTTSDNVILTVSTILDVQNGLHTQVVDNVDLSQEHNLAIQDGLHGLISDNVNLTQDHTLVVNDALHATISDIINLTVPTGAITPEARIFVINEDDRVYIIAKENRIFTVTN